jgi:hypothetical protein
MLNEEEEEYEFFFIIDDLFRPQFAVGILHHDEILNILEAM